MNADFEMLGGLGNSIIRRIRRLGGPQRAGHPAPQSSVRDDPPAADRTSKFRLRHPRVVALHFPLPDPPRADGSDPGASFHVTRFLTNILHEAFSGSKMRVRIVVSSHSRYRKRRFVPLMQNVVTGAALISVRYALDPHRTPMGGRCPPWSVVMRKKTGSL